MVALQKTIEFANGTSASYWKIISLDLDILGKGGRFQLAGYIDKASKDAGKQPLQTEVIQIDSDKFDTFFGFTALDAAGENPVKGAYAYAKQWMTQESATDPVTGEPTNVGVQPWADALDV